MNADLTSSSSVVSVGFTNCTPPQTAGGCRSSSTIGLSRIDTEELSIALARGSGRAEVHELKQTS